MLKLILTLLSIIFFSTFINAQTADSTKINEVEKNLVGLIHVDGEAPWSIKERMGHYHVNALSVAVIQDYKITWAKAYGWADDSLKIAATDQTLFQGGSISKSLNAVGVLRLAQEKKIDIYADINNYLESWKFPYDSVSKGKKINIANLLSHTSGLNMSGFDGHAIGTPLPSVVQVLSGSEEINFSDRIKSIYEPGIKYEYSGGGIEISQVIVMDVTHLPYEQYMYKKILKPLGMNSSTFQQPPIDKKPELLATGYRANGTRIPGNYNIFPEQAAAGLWTNPTDLAKYIIETQLALTGKSQKVLDQKMTKLRLTPYIDKQSALGVFINYSDNTGYFMHDGATKGFRAIYYGSLEAGNGVVVMVNSDNGKIMREVINSVAKVYGFKGLYSSKLVKVVAVVDSTLQSYTGEYALSDNFHLMISKDGEHMYCQGTGQNKFEIFPEGQNKFFAKELALEIEFIKNDNSKIVNLVLYQGGAREAKKIK
ncbi:MAG TPA: serine hydrolase [Puia sp.]|nr:serine hydrolase [Puia sp.]